MCYNDKKCHAWISLESIGIPVNGCLKNTDWLNSIQIPCSHSLLNQSMYIDNPNETLLCIKNLAHGKFGYIDEALYQTSSYKKNVYVKRPIITGKSLLYEACIQKLVGENLSYIGFPTGAAKIQNIFRLKDNSICFSMEQFTNATTLNRFLDSVDNTRITKIIIESLLQLSAMVWYLDTTLGINHRDLKPSNFLITEHTPIERILQIDNNILEIESSYSLTFIDFGFSCLGSTETHISDISLSTVYSKEDPCPKEGRDMYLFLAFMYVDFYDKFSQTLLNLFENWLHIPGSNIVGFLRRNKELSKKWIYFMAGNENIKQFNSSPSKIVKDLQTFI
jgi:serine/threonine protein kinase